MSTTDFPTVDALPDSTPRLRRLTRAVGNATRGVAFWSSIALAFAQIPLFVGNVTGGNPRLLVALLAVNLAAMALGSDYRE